MTLNARTKGQDGEREVIKLLLPIVREVLGPNASMSRNLEQYQKGGHDIVGIPWLAIEVKRQEELMIEDWWRQTLRQTSGPEVVPLLIFRQNRKRWRVMTWGQVGELTCRVEITLDDFLLFFRKELYRRDKA